MNLEIIYPHQVSLEELQQRGQSIAVALDHTNCKSLYTPTDTVRYFKKAVQILDEKGIDFAKIPSSKEDGKFFISVDSRNWRVAFDCVEESRCSNCSLATRDDKTIL
jgi:hypothetical protein